MTKKAYLTIDVEEWYHLDYLKNYNVDKNKVEMVPQIFNFLDMLNSLDIKATFFVLGEIAYDYADIIRDIKDRGHEIGCHGLDHELLYNKTDEQFKEEIINAKDILDSILGQDAVRGYRASCFSMNRNKLNLLTESGYTYDSSYISFTQHPLYDDLDLSGFNSKEDLIYESNNFLEFEVPTYQIGKYNIPISGGGYLRLFPYPIIQRLIKKHFKQKTNFVFYLHPFELTNLPLPLPSDLPFKDKFRAKIGRKGNLNKLNKLLKSMLKDGVEFKTMGEELNA